MNRKSLLANFYLLAIGLVLMGLLAACDGEGDPAGGSGDIWVDSSGLACPDCIVRGSAPTASTSHNGDYKHATYQLPVIAYPAGATVYYPIDAKPPMASLVYCPGHGATEDSMALWGPFFASHGIVMVTMNTTRLSDDVGIRAKEQRDALNALQNENRRIGSPLCGKLSNRFGLMGWSMGGGATWINAAQVPGLKSAMTMAGHNLSASSAADGSGIQCPTLIMSGADDNTPLGGWGQSESVYDAISDSVSKIVYEIRNVNHFMWYSPVSAGPEAGELALAFQKTFLEGDARWAKFLTEKPANATVWETNLVRGIRQ